MGKKGAGHASPGKSAPAAPVPVSKDVQALVEHALRLQGKAPSIPVPKQASKGNPPVATPVRSKQAAPKPGTASPSDPKGVAASPMSVASTPIKSPELKRLRSVASEGGSSSGTIPSLPSFSASTNDDDEKVHRLDTATTISLGTYMKNLAIEGLELFSFLFR